MRTPDEKLQLSQLARASSKAVRQLGPVDVLILAAWCGLAAGELDVAVRIAHRALSSTQRLYLMTRHFVWLVPLVNLVLFLGLRDAAGPGDPTLAAVGRDGGALG